MSMYKAISRIPIELQRSWVITKKDARMYYFQPQSFMMGILFPVALFLSFALGRDLPADILIPGLMAITILFSSSSIGPLAVPTERRTKTYERMMVAPISPISIIFGEVCGGAIFGAIIAYVPLAIGLVFFGTNIGNPAGMILGILLVSFEFSAMGVMFSAIPTENPANVMMIVNIVRLPLIFVSGIFFSIAQMGTYGAITLLSPLTYAADLFKLAIGGSSFYGPGIDCLGIIVFTIVFLVIGVFLHERNRKIG